MRSLEEAWQAFVDAALAGAPDEEFNELVIEVSSFAPNPIDVLAVDALHEDKMGRTIPLEDLAREYGIRLDADV